MGTIKCNTIENKAGTASWSVDTMGIESGSTDGYSWTKFPDGTAIIGGFFVVTPNTNGDFTAAGFPDLGFTLLPVLTNGDTASALCTLHITPLGCSNTAIAGRATNVDGTPQTSIMRVNFHAVGRWK